MRFMTLAIAQAFDFATFSVMVRLHGVVAEANPLVKNMFLQLGTPAVALSTVTDPIDDDNETTATASGTGEAGAEISLVASDGTTTIDAVITSVSLDGTWSIIDIDVSGLDDGTITFTVTATDSFGNAADASKTATKSTTAPLVDMVMGEEDDWS